MKFFPSTLAATLVGALISIPTSLHAALIPVDPAPVDAAVEEYTPHDLRVREGNAALQARDFAAARTTFEEALRLVPTSYQAMLGLAAAAHAGEERVTALDWLAKALVAAPDNAAVVSAHARLSTEVADLTGAADRLQAAVGAHPGAREVRLALANWLAMQLQRPGDAIPHYRELLAQKADDSAVLAGLGMAMLADNLPADSIDVLNRALEVDPKNDRARRALGHAYLRADRAEDALKTFAAIIEGGQDDAGARLGKADALVALGRVDAALEDYAAAARLAPQVAGVRVRQGAALERAGRAGDAETAYLAALAVDERNLLALNNLAYLSAERKTRLDEALAWAQKAVEVGGERAALLDTLGWVHAARGETDQARAVLERALALSPDHAAARRHLEALTTPPMPAVAKASTAQSLTSKPLSESELADVGAAPATPETAAEPAAADAAQADAAAPDTAATATAMPDTAEVAAKKTTDVSATDAATPDADVAEARVLAALEQWRQAWEDKDIDTYVAMYVTTNSPRADLSRSDWEADRQRKLDKRGAIRVEVIAPEVVVDGDMATVVFEQHYESRNYRDRTRKTLTWRETDGQWRIAQEQSRPM